VDEHIGLSNGIAEAVDAPIDRAVEPVDEHIDTVSLFSLFVRAS